MKKTYSIVWIFVFFLAFPLAKAEAGTFLFGVKYWHTEWDSGILKWIGKEYDARWKAKGIDSTTSFGTGSGNLAGPLLGYQSADGKWSISFVPMVISNFSQDLDNTILGISSRTSIDTTRYDYDLAGSYSLSQFKNNYPFLEYCKIFAGYKYQYTKNDIKFVLPGTQTETDTAKFNLNMLTVGFGLAYPVSDKIAIGIQGGSGLAFVENKSNPDNSIAYNAEASLNFLPIDKMIFQIGYRYQFWYYSPNGDILEKGDFKDVNYGPSLTLVYTF